MQISDLHVGNRFDHNYIINSMIEAQKYNHDFAGYTGDYVSYESNEQIGVNKEMQHITHGSIGTFGILGNHDYGKNWADQEVADSISEVLKNIKYIFYATLSHLKTD
tara:strand:+ start:112 stop:432 length:321 start_codon:yes stop_codon:yes gene_type:complete